MEDIETTPMIKEPRKFDTTHRAYWGLASFGGAIINGIYAAMLSIFVTDYLGLVNAADLVFYISIIYAVVNALNDPLVGILSDRSRAEKGRRIPFMKYTAPFLGLTFILIWFAPSAFGEIAVFIWLLIMTALYDTAYTIIFLLYSALLPEITEDEKERNGLQVFASFFSLIGQILGFVIPDLLRNLPGLLPFQMAMIGVGVVGSLLIILTTLKFEERPEFTKVDEPLGMKDALVHTFKSNSFVTLVSANFFQILMQSLILGSVFYIADYIVGTSSIILLVFIFLPLLIGIWVTPKLIDKFGVVKGDQILLFIGGVSLVTLTFMPDLISIGIALSFAGIGFVGPLIFTNVLFAQVADEDEVETGVRREGVFFGINALITKPAQSIALVIPTALLAISGFVPRVGTVIQPQPFSAIVAMRIFTGLIPGLCLLIAGTILFLYPLKGAYWKEVQQKVLEMHKEKEERLKAMERS
ncbi:MAG: hypothetical protein GF317_05245 [Candidatus Lokiarchaeota archaeon]|nr:hypothetical protein [Candidatus Lokiarchaeota archaeon]MBD3199212.1 hypothetical protein [Candidatus Lokiarchaeota archaeon]